MNSDLLVQTTQVPLDPNMIDLGVGQPEAALLPLQRIARAAEKRFAQGDPNFLQYGAEQGDGYLRLALAQFLSQGYGFPVEPSDLFITSGASMGLDLVCTLFAQPGDTIFVEEPSYFLALRIFKDHRLRPVPIPVDENGLILEALEEALARNNHPAFLYTIPTFQNPTGYTLSAERRDRLAALSQERSFLIVADEVYHFLSYTRQPPKAFAGYTAQGNVISLGSFSKILAPGLRLGWIQTKAGRVKALASSGLLDSGGGLNPFTSAIVRGVLESHDLEANIDELRSVYGARVELMDRGLQARLPGAAYQVPHGGFFFWIQLPDGIDAEALLRRAEEFQVSFRPGIRFSSRGGFHDYIRLSFAFYGQERLEQGLEHLQRALEK